MTKRPWYRWPEDKRNGTVPWFVVLRRLLALPLVWAGATVLFVGVLAGYGWRDAVRFVRDAL